MSVPINDSAWKTASDKVATSMSMQGYFTTFMDAMASASQEAIGGDWKLHRVTVSNDELYGAYLLESPQNRGQILVSVGCDSKVVKVTANVTLPLQSAQFDVHGGGRVIAGSAWLGRNIMSLVTGQITRLHPNNRTVFEGR